MTLTERISLLEKQVTDLKGLLGVGAVERPAIRTVKVGDLEWQADVPDKRFTWGEAKAYAASLGDGWRLPTMQELLSQLSGSGRRPRFRAIRRSRGA